MFCVRRTPRFLLPVFLLIGWSVVNVSAQSIRREFWTGIPGSSVDSLIASADYPDSPSGTDFPTMFEGPLNWAENYGTRFRGYVHPPTAGDYTFWISGDDNCLLYVGTDETPVSRQLVASVASWTSSREWAKEPNQQSAPIHLEAGKRYYVEALQKEGEGGDNIAVGWRLPSGALERPIPGSRLSPFMISFDPPSLVSEPQDLDLEEGQQAVFRVGATGAEPLTFQWERNGTPLFGENQHQLVIDPVTLADDEALFSCVVQNPLGSVTSRAAVLRVRSESTPPAMARVTPAPNATVRTLNQVEVFFTEIVSGVSADDLLLDGQPATSVTGFGAGPYTFSFASWPVEPVIVTVAWTPNHAIEDLARSPNAFAGGQWQLQHDPAATLDQIVINEFLASNSGGLTDEDGDAVDWIEIHNRGGSTVNLTGWSLSDDPKNPGQWMFPEVTLPSGTYLVLFASGKDRRSTDPRSRLHLNFKLSQTGESLALYSPELSRTLVDGFSEPYPDQRSSFSYGRSAGPTWHYFATPTPGAVNGSDILTGLTEAPHFSTERGNYVQAPTIHLSSATPGATIRYTTDGGEPTLTRGNTYTQPLTASGVYTLRAAAFHPQKLPSRVVTHTYLSGRAGGNRSLPLLSLVTDNSHLWGPTGIMEPGNTINRGLDWERPVSAEFIRTEDSGGFAVDCGLRIQGGNFVRDRYDPTASLPFSKYSFRLYFRGDYGPSTLRYPLIPDLPVDEFERIVLRAGMNDHSNPYIVDELVRRLHGNMGHVASHGTFVHLYLNGQYKGYYNPTERVDDDFLRSWSGSNNDWDVMAQGNEVVSGDMVEWNQLSTTILGTDLSQAQNYAAVANRLDIDAFIDYLLVNIYAGMGDWPWNNWRAARERVAGAKWFFVVWDAEWGLGNLGRSVTQNTITEELGSSSPIANFFRALTVNPDFRLRFADRFHLHFFNGGALTDESILAQYWDLRNQMAGALPGMVDRIHNVWIPRRRGIILQHLADAGLQASDHVPEPNQQGGTVPPGFIVSLSTDLGAIYYTLDGTDPAASQTGSGHDLALVSETAPKQVLVPSTANGGDLLGEAWKGAQEPFDASNWTTGIGGVGYDRNNDYTDYFTIDVRGEMDGIQGSVFVRLPFEVPAGTLDGLDSLKLQMRYDDGFTAYLNGALIASANVPADPSWDATATTGNPDNVAVNWQWFDVSSHLDLLRSGQNVLAIQGLNAGLGSSDLLIDCTLSAAEPGQVSPSPTALSYTQPFALEDSAVIKARTLLNDQWSALLEAPFVVNLPGIPLRITEIMYHPFGGEAYEFLELANLSSISIDLSGMHFEGINFLFPSGTSLTGKARLILASNSDPQAFAQRYPPTPIGGYYGGALANDGERIALLDRQGGVIHAVTYDDSPPWPSSADGAGHSLELLDPYTDPNAVESWIPSTALGGSPGSPPPTPSAPDVQLSEVMAENLDSSPHEGAFPDWIELHNTSATAFDLTGWSLSDSSDPRRFVFPSGTTLASHGYLVVWADTNLTLSGLHTGFSLKLSGETLALYNSEAEPIDVLTFGPQIPDTTLGRTVDTGSAWTLCEPTPGADNVPMTTATPDYLHVNEWLASSLPGDNDWFELYNSHASLPLALQGLTLTHQGTFFRISSPLFISAAGFIVLTADKQPGPSHVEFKLAATGGTLRLLDKVGSILDTISFGPQTEGVAQGRLPDGTGTIAAFPLSPSPGSGNYLVTPSGPRLNEFLADNRSFANHANGRASDWIELHNPTTQPLDLTGYGLAIDNPNQPDWHFPSGALLPPDGYLLLTCDDALPASAQTQETMNISRSLPREGGTLTLLDSSQQILSQVNYGPQLPDQSSGWIGDSWRLLRSITPAAANSAAQSLGDPYELRINEWMANPAQDAGWFEIHNRSTLPVDLQGLRLTDDATIAGLTKHPSLPPLSLIGAESWLQFIASGESTPSPDHVSFKLDARGEYLAITTGLATIDGVHFGVQAQDVSMGRFPDGLDSFQEFPASSSPGEPNYVPLESVVVNEILAHTDPPLEDAIELVNLSRQTVDIGGWYLSDSASDLRKYRVPDNTLLLPGSFHVFHEVDLDGGLGSTTPFTLNSYLGDAVYLSAADATDTLTGHRSQVRFGPTANGVSLGRTVTTVGADFAPQIQPSFGVDNPGTVTEFRMGAGAPNIGPRIGPVVVQEIMATPPVLGDFEDNTDAEFLEVSNAGSQSIALFDPLHPENTWRFDAAVQFTFPESFTLAPGEEVMIVRFEPAAEPSTLLAFRHRYGFPQTTRILGPYQGRLADEGERVELLRPDSPQTSGPDAGLVPHVLVERILYASSPPWPSAGVGLGASLQRLSPELYGNDPAHWVTHSPSPGLATIDITLDTDNDGMPDSWERDYGLDPDNAADAQADEDGDRMLNAAEFVAGTDPTAASSLLRLQSRFDSLSRQHQLTFRAAAGVSYSVQYRDALEPGTWSNLLHLEPGYVGSSLDITDPSPIEAQRFYRIVTPIRP